MVPLRILSIFGGMILGLTAAEVVGRLALPDRNWSPKSGLSSSQLVLRKGGHHKTAPNMATVSFSDFFPPVTLFTDEDGNRCPDPRIARPDRAAARERVYVGGASYTFGMGVAAELAWPFVLEHELANDTRWGPIQVTDAAQPGYALPQMLAEIENLADDELPDRVIIALPTTGLYMLGLGSEAGDFEFINVRANAMSLLALRYDADHFPELEEKDGWLLIRDRRFRGTWLDELRNRSCIGHRTILRYEAAFAPTVLVQKRDRSFDKANLMALARRIGERLGRLADRLAARNIATHLVILPVRWTDIVDVMTQDRLDLFEAFYSGAGLDAKRIDRVDLFGPGPLQVVIDTRRGGDILEHDRHYSARGHARIAERLLAWYRAVVPPRPRLRRPR